MTTYDDILTQIRSEFEALQSKASEYIPKLYAALKEEAGENFDPHDARDRIEKDCVQFWRLTTIRNHLPAEAKDQTKAKAGRAGARRKQEKKKEEEGEEESLLTPNEQKQEIVVGASPAGSTTEVDPPQQPERRTIADVVTPPAKNDEPVRTYEEDVTQELIETQAKLKETEEQVKTLAQAMKAIEQNIKASPAFRQLEEELKQLKKENDELRTSIEQNQQFVSAKKVEEATYVGVVKADKLTELFVVIRNAITKKRDVEIKFGADRNYLVARGVNQI